MQKFKMDYNNCFNIVSHRLIYLFIVILNLVVHIIIVRNIKLTSSVSYILCLYTDTSLSWHDILISINTMGMCRGIYVSICINSCFNSFVCVGIYVLLHIYVSVARTMMVTLNSLTNSWIIEMCSFSWESRSKDGYQLITPWNKEWRKFAENINKTALV